MLSCTDFWLFFEACESFFNVNLLAIGSMSNRSLESRTGVGTFLFMIVVAVATAAASARLLFTDGMITRLALALQRRATTAMLVVLAVFTF